MGIWDGKAWGTDLSGFQDTATFSPGVIDFGVARMNVSNGDPTEDAHFSQHIQAFYDGYALSMAYWVVNSSWYTSRQMTMINMQQQGNANHPILNRIQASLKGKAVAALWFDLELDGAGDVWNAAYLEDLRNRIASLKASGGFPKIPLGVYSRKSWIDRMPAVQTWLDNHPEIMIWTANYRTQFPGMAGSTLAQVRQSRQPSVLADHAPIWYGGTARNMKRFWQYHGTAGGCQPITCLEVKGNGVSSGLDLNISEYTRAEMFTAFGVVDRLGQIDPPIEPPATNPDLAALAARVKAIEDKLAAAKAAL